MENNENILHQCVKLVQTADSLDRKGQIDLSDQAEKMANELLFKYAFLPDEEMEVFPLAGEQFSQQVAPETLLEPDPSLEDEEIEEEVSPEDIEKSIEKFEAIMEVMGDEFDPDLIPVAKKVLMQIIEQFEEIEAAGNAIEETIEEESIAQPTLPQLQPQTIANIARSTFKLAHKAEIFDENGHKEVAQNIDELVENVEELIRRI